MRNQYGDFAGAVQDIELGRFDAAREHIKTVIDVIAQSQTLQQESVDQIMAFMSYLEGNWPQESAYDILQYQDAVLKIMIKTKASDAIILSLIVPRIDRLIAAGDRNSALHYCGYVAQRFGFSHEIQPKVTAIENSILLSNIVKRDGVIAKRLELLHQQLQPLMNELGVESIDVLKMRLVEPSVIKFFEQIDFINQVYLLLNQISCLNHKLSEYQEFYECYGLLFDSPFVDYIQICLRFRNVNDQRFVDLLKQIEVIRTQLLQHQRHDLEDVFCNAILGEVRDKDHGAFHIKIHNAIQRQDKVCVKALLDELEAFGDRLVTHQKYDNAKECYQKGLQLLNDRNIEKLFMNGAKLNVKALGEFRDGWIRLLMEKMNDPTKVVTHHPALLMPTSLEVSKDDLESARHKAREALRLRTNIVNVSEDFCHDVEQIVTKLISSIEQVIGQAPMKYSVMGLGSFARMEGAPHSDLEFAILTEKAQEQMDGAERKYFQLLLKLLEAKVIMFGEDNRVIKAIVHDSNKGFCFDDGGNTPVGKPDELLGRPERLVENFRVESYDQCLVGTLYDASLLYGDKELFNQFITLRRTALNEVIGEESGEVVAKGIKRRESLAIALLRDNLDDWYQNREYPENVIDIKKHICRFPNFMLKMLCMYHGLNETGESGECNSINRMDALVSHEHMSIEVQSLFKFWLKKGLLLRYRAHLSHNCENDKLALTEGNIGLFTQMQILYAGLVLPVAQAAINKDFANGDFIATVNRHLLVNCRMVRGELLILRHRISKQESDLEKASWYMHHACELDIEAAEAHWQRKWKDFLEEPKVNEDGQLQLRTDGEVRVIIYDHDVRGKKEYRLKPEAADAFMNPDNLEQEGAREVVRIFYSGRSFHLKKLPEWPGREYMASKLDHLFIGYTTPFSQLVRMCYKDHDGQNIDIPVLISDTMHGRSLFKIGLDNANILDEIDPISYARNFVRTALITPEDDQPSNMLLQILRSPRGEIGKILVSIDNDRGFLNEVAKESFSIFSTSKIQILSLNLKSILYCADRMKKIADPHVKELIEHIVTQDLQRLLEKWGQYCCQRNDEHRALFEGVVLRGKVLNSKDSLFQAHYNAKTKQIMQAVITMPVYDSVMNEIYQKIEILKDNFRLQQEYPDSYISLLRLVEPVGGYGYEKILSEQKSAFERFSAISKGQYEIVRINVEREERKVSAAAPQMASIPEDEEFEEDSPVPPPQVQDKKYTKENSLASAVNSAKFTKSALGKELNKHNLAEYDFNTGAWLKFMAFTILLQTVAKKREDLINGDESILTDLNSNVLTAQRIINGAISPTGRVYEGGVFYEIEKRVDEELEEQRLRAGKPAMIKHMNPFEQYEAKQERNRLLMERQTPVLNAIMTLNKREVRALNLSHCAPLNNSNLPGLMSKMKHLRWLDLTASFNVHMGNVISQLEYNEIELSTLYTQDEDRLNTMRIRELITMSKSMTQSAKDEALLEAAGNGDIERVKEVILLGAVVNSGSGVWAGGSTKASPLVAALDADNAEMVTILLNKGADPNISYWFLGNSLVFTKSDAMMDLLLSYGAKAKFGLTSIAILSDARGINVDNCREQQSIWETVQKLMLAGMKANEGFWGMTPFMAACLGGQYKTILQMIERGANIHTKAISILTPLHLVSVSMIRYSEFNAPNFTAKFAIDGDHLECGSTKLYLEEDKLCLKLGEHHTPFVIESKESDADGISLPLYNKIRDIIGGNQEHGPITDIESEQIFRTAYNKFWIGESRESLQVVKVLLDKGAYVDATVVGGTSLFLAASTGMEKLTQLLISRGANVNAQLYSYTIIAQIANIIPEAGKIINSYINPLHLACWMRQLHTTKILLDNGAQINARDKAGRTPLHWAMRSFDDKSFNENEVAKVERVVTFLLSKGADIQAQDKYGRKCTFYAATSGSKRLLSLLQQHGVTIDKTMLTPLHYAVILGDIEGVQSLISQGDDINALDNRGRSPLVYAIKKGHDNIARHLLDSGASYEIPDKKRATALFHAVKHRRWELVDHLIDIGANINIRDTKNRSLISLLTEDNWRRGWRKEIIIRVLKMNPIISSSHAKKIAQNVVKLNDLDILKSIINIRPEAVNVQDDDKNTPLTRAIEADREDLVVEWLRLRANPNAVDKNGETSLFHALSKKSIFQLLLENGAKVNACNTKQVYVLHKAAALGYIEIVSLLLDHGANPNVKDKEGWTPIAMPCTNGHKEVVRLLLARGATVRPTRDNPYSMLHVMASLSLEEFERQLRLDPSQDINLANRNGNTVLMRAVWSKNYDTVIKLIHMGVDINKTNKSKETALHCAILNDDFIMANILLDKGADPHLLCDKTGNIHKNLWEKATGETKELLNEINFRNKEVVDKEWVNQQMRQVKTGAEDGVKYGYSYRSAVLRSGNHHYYDEMEEAEIDELSFAPHGVSAESNDSLLQLIARGAVPEERINEVVDCIIARIERAAGESLVVANTMRDIGVLIEKDKIPSSRIDEVVSLLIRKISSPAAVIKESAGRVLNKLIERDKIADTRWCEIVPLLVENTQDQCDNARSNAVWGLMVLIIKQSIPKMMLQEVLHALISRVEDSCEVVKQNAIKGIVRMIEGSMVLDKYMVPAIEALMSKILDRNSCGDSAVWSIEGLATKLPRECVQRASDLLISKVLVESDDTTIKGAVIAIAKLSNRDDVVLENPSVLSTLIRFSTAKGNVKYSAIEGIMHLAEKDRIPANKLDEVISVLHASITDPKCLHYAVSGLIAFTNRDKIDKDVLRTLQLFFDVKMQRVTFFSSKDQQAELVNNVCAALDHFVEQLLRNAVNTVHIGAGRADVIANLKILSEKGYEHKVLQILDDKLQNLIVYEKRIAVIDLLILVFRDDTNLMLNLQQRKDVEEQKHREALDEGALLAAGTASSEAVISIVDGDELQLDSYKLSVLRREESGQEKAMIILETKDLRGRKIITLSELLNQRSYKSSLGEEAQRREVFSSFISNRYTDQCWRASISNINEDDVGRLLSCSGGYREAIYDVFGQRKHSELGLHLNLELLRDGIPARLCKNYDLVGITQEEANRRSGARIDDLEEFAGEQQAINDRLAEEQFRQAGVLEGVVRINMLTSIEFDNPLLNRSDRAEIFRVASYYGSTVGMNCIIDMGCNQDDYTYLEKLIIKDGVEAAILGVLEERAIEHAGSVRCK